MNLDQLRDRYRKRTDDNANPPALDDDELDDAANEAQEEACRRSKLLVDSSTAPICSIAVGIATALYAVDPRVIKILRLKLANRTQPLARKGLRDIDRENPGWETDTGEPTHYIPDFQTGKIRLYPIPVAADTATLTVQRLPIADMEADDDEPELDRHLHRKLVSWMAYRGYSKPDTDQTDGNKAAEALAEFESEFGQKASAQEEAWQQRNADFLTEEGNY